MRTPLALLLLLLALLASGCEQDVEIPGATAVVDAPAQQRADNSAQLAPTAAAPAPDVQTPTSLPLANVLTGRVTAISDGDTLTVLDATNTSHRIRLQGIDAPEGEQPFSDGSTQALREKLLGETVRIEWREKDRYGRTLGHAYLDGRYINREMIAEGWAWHYEYYWPDDEFAQAERDARAARRGLWADERPVARWDFRRNPRAYLPAAGTNGSGRAPAGEGVRPAGDEPIVYVTRTGEKYHAAGCRHLRKSAITMKLSEVRERNATIYRVGG